MPPQPTDKQLWNADRVTFLRLFAEHVLGSRLGAGGTSAEQTIQTDAEQLLQELERLPLEAETTISSRDSQFEHLKSVFSSSINIRPHTPEGDERWVAIWLLNHRRDRLEHLWPAWFSKDAPGVVERERPVLKEPNDPSIEGDIIPESGHTQIEDMPKFDIDALAKSLQSLADVVADNPTAAKSLLEAFPESCRVIRERLAPASEAPQTIHRSSDEATAQDLKNAGKLLGKVGGQAAAMSMSSDERAARSSKGGKRAAKSMTPQERQTRASAGGKKAAESMTAEERSERARKAVLAREAKKKRKS